MLRPSGLRAGRACGANSLGIVQNVRARRARGASDLQRETMSLVLVELLSMGIMSGSPPKASKRRAGLRPKS